MVVGIPCAINPPTGYSSSILTRDLPLMVVLSASIALFGFNRKNPKANGVVSRKEAMLWILIYVAYVGFMVYQEGRTA